MNGGYELEWNKNKASNKGNRGSVSYVSRSLFRWEGTIGDTDVVLFN